MVCLLALVLTKSVLGEVTVRMPQTLSFRDEKLPIRYLIPSALWMSLPHTRA